MIQVLNSGKTSFKIEVPYKLIESGERGTPKPLIVYLHGYKQNLAIMRKKCKPLLEIEAYHLFIEGPYPIFDAKERREVKYWGRAWYLYDGRPNQFVRSLEVTSEFIQEIIESVMEFVDVNKVCVFGYSMGGYLAGYFALSRWKHVSECIVIGGRIKTEIFEGRLENASHIKFLALHGDKDESVSSDAQKKSIDILSSNGISAFFRAIDASHALSPEYVMEAMSWLLKNCYKKSENFV